MYFSGGFIHIHYVNGLSCYFMLALQALKVQRTYRLCKDLNRLSFRCARHIGFANNEGAQDILALQILKVHKTYWLYKY